MPIANIEIVKADSFNRAVKKHKKIFRNTEDDIEWFLEATIVV